MQCTAHYWVLTGHSRPVPQLTGCWALRPGLLMEARERGLSPSCELRVWRERSQSQTRSLARTAVLLSEDWPRALATAWAGCWVSSSHYSPLPGQDGWHRHAPHTHSLAPHLSYEGVSCYLLNAIWPEMMETKDAKYDIISWFLHYMTNMLSEKSHRVCVHSFQSILLYYIDYSEKQYLVLSELQ